MITFPCIVPVIPNTTYKQQKPKTEFREEDALNNEDILHGYDVLIESFWA